MLASEGTSAAVEQFAQHSGRDHFVRSVLSRLLRPLHRAISGAGGREEQLYPAGRPGHSRQWPYDDVGKKQSSDRRGDRRLARQHASLKDFMRNRHWIFIAVCGAALDGGATPALAG